jgi:hypothetical protein
MGTEYKYHFYYLFMTLSIALTIRLKRQNAFVNIELDEMWSEVKWSEVVLVLFWHLSEELRRIRKSPSELSISGLSFGPKISTIQSIQCGIWCVLFFIWKHCHIQVTKICGDDLQPQPLEDNELHIALHWIGGWVDPRAGLDDMEKWKFLPPPGLKLWQLCRPACSQPLYQLSYPGSH